MPHLLDARGLKCPLPVIKTEKMLEGLAAGAELTVLASDPMARIDIPLYCRQNGYEVEMSSEPDHLRFVITKRG